MFARPRVRILSASCLALTLALAAPLAGCDKGGLVETTFPSEGVQLAYDLKPGSGYEGQIERRETINSRGQSMNRSISFSVVLQVSGVEADGTARVAATVHHIELNWNVPGLPISMNEFNAKAKQMLEGVTIRFGVKPDGSVVDVPATPPDFGEAEAGVLDSVIEGLTGAFFIVPTNKLKAGEGWEESDSRGREGKLGKYTVETTSGTMVGMFERTLEGPNNTSSTQTVAKLDIDTDKSETTTTKDGSSEIRTRAETTVLFEPSGYLAKLDSKQTRIQGATSSTVEFRAKWARTRAGAAGAGTPAGGEKPATQAITDPCNDDYVGPDDCLDPCNSNYMGEEACAEAAPVDGAAPAEDAPAEGVPAGDAEADESAATAG